MQISHFLYFIRNCEQSICLLHFVKIQQGGSIHITYTSPSACLVGLGFVFPLFFFPTPSFPPVCDVDDLAECMDLTGEGA